MVRNEESIHIDRPIGAVFEFLADIPSTVQWQPGVLNARKTSPGPVGRGTTFVIERKTPFKTFESLFEISEYEPPRRLVWSTKSGPMQARLAYTLHEERGGTRVDFEGDIETAGLFKLLAPLVKMGARREGKVAFRDLKAALEK